MWLTIDRSSSVSIIRQVYGQIKSMILEGKLLAGDRLPSTRGLSEKLEVSRNVILEAYSQLMAEGYIEAIRGSGTVVAKDTYYKRNEIRQEKSILNTMPEQIDNEFISFRSGIPALNKFPKREWGSLFNKICSNLHYSKFGYSWSEGTIELRQALSKYLFRVRGICCSPKQIMITSGSTQGLSLISKMLYSPNAEIIVEDPVHCGLLKVIISHGYSIRPIPVDNKGIRTDMLNEANKTGFIYVTPSHQFPLGEVLPIQRRIELIKFAEKNDCYIVEDDYDSEFRYQGRPMSSLYELDPNRVIYVGSFSKILSPALRLGYIILPDSLINKYLKIKKYTDVHTEIMNQLVLSEFINEGRLEKYIWKMKKEYLKKREAVVNSLSINFPEQHTVGGHAAGLHLVAEFKDVFFTEKLLRKIKQQKVIVYPVERYAINKGSHSNKIILGYGHLSIEEIEKGISRIKEGISSLYLSTE